MLIQSLKVMIYNATFLAMLLVNVAVNRQPGETQGP